jgi:hypothetical protein
MLAELPLEVQYKLWSFIRYNHLRHTYMIDYILKEEWHEISCRNHVSHEYCNRVFSQMIDKDDHHIVATVALRTFLKVDRYVLP